MNPKGDVKVCHIIFNVQFNSYVIFHLKPTKMSHRMTQGTIAKTILIYIYGTMSNDSVSAGLTWYVIV